MRQMRIHSMLIDLDFMVVIMTNLNFFMMRVVAVRERAGTPR
jgi:hypothetical protein